MPRTMHMAPPGEGMPTPCCHLPLTALPGGDGVTIDTQFVTCGQDLIDQIETITSWEDLTTEFDGIALVTRYSPSGHPLDYQRLNPRDVVLIRRVPSQRLPGVDHYAAQAREYLARIEDAARRALHAGEPEPQGMYAAHLHLRNLLDAIDRENADKTEGEGRCVEPAVDGLYCTEHARRREAARKGPGTFPPIPTSWNVTHGGCGVLLNSDTECSRRAGHESPHRAHDPSGRASWVEFTDDGTIVAESRRLPAAWNHDHTKGEPPCPD